MLWIPITIAAAGFQTARTALQHRLRDVLAPSAAGFVRYVYGAPIALAAVAVVWVSGVSLPSIAPRFWPAIVAGGLAQIVGTVALLRAFAHRDFAVGTVFAKTEVVQVAVFSLAVLGEPLRIGGWVGAAVCTVGVVLLAAHGQRLTWAALRQPAARYGLAAGGLFGLAAIGIRGATKALDGGPVVVRALLALAVMNSAQTLIHGGWLAWRDRADLGRTFTHWRRTLPVGVLSVCGSAGWAWALALENAAKVRTLGQVELLITFTVSHRLLGERHARGEMAASALVLVGVLAVVVLG